MSQKVIIVSLSDAETSIKHYEEPSVPTEEDIESLARDYELKGKVEATYEWYCVGEGESGIDIFFSDSEIATMDETGDFMKACESKGFSCDFIQGGTIRIDVNDEDFDCEAED